MLLSNFFIYAKAAFINTLTVFIASVPVRAKNFQKAGMARIVDDIKS